MFITFEGGEGAGKTTQIEKLKCAFEGKGKQVIATREPGGTELGEHVRDVLLNPKFSASFGAKAELMLYLTSRVQHLEEVILPALAAGTIVICDRFNDSSVAYQGGGRELGFDYVRRLCDLACGGIVPYATFFLDLSPEAGMRRLNREKDRLENESLDFHGRVRQAFLDIARQEPHRVHQIDASKSVEAVHQDILSKVE